MEILQRVSSNFDCIKDALKNKSGADRLQSLKKYIYEINKDLSDLSKNNPDLDVRSIALEGYNALLTAKTISTHLIEKRNVLQAAYEKLKKYALRDEILFIFLRVQNLLCYFLIQLDHINTARDILESTEILYDQISKTEPDRYLDAEDLFSVKPNIDVKRVNPEKIDKVITNNVQMQAFLHNKLNLPEKYTMYNHIALRRQLEMKDGTPQEWALRCARLGNYFTYLNQIANARHHLCAAYHVLKTCHDNCKLRPEEFVVQKPNFELHFLELSHHWVKYGLSIFKLSKKRFLTNYFTNPEGATANTMSTSNVWRSSVGEQGDEMFEESMKEFGAEKFEKEDYPDKLFTFPTLELKRMEARVPSMLANNEEGARKLFSFTHKWLMRAKHYYDFEHYSAEYITCSLQLAELYEHLAFFEKNIDCQYNIQKRRANVLEALNALLKNCDDVMSVQIDVIRELSQVQLELMALNLQKLWREESQTNLRNMFPDTNSILTSLDTNSNKTLTEKTLNTSSKNLFLRKMEATNSLSGKLFRLSSQLDPGSVSQLSFSL